PDECIPANAWALIADPSDLTEAVKYEADRKDSPLHLIARDLLDTHENNEEHFADFRSSAMQKLSCYERPGLLEDVGYESINRHKDIIERQIIVFIVSPPQYQMTFGTYFAQQIYGFQNALKNHPGKRKVEFILDEFTNAPLSALVEDMTILRSLGGRFHLMAQANSEIVRKYGQEAAKTIDETTDIKQIMAVGSPAEAKALSEALSLGPGETYSYGFSSQDLKVSETISASSRPLMNMDEILSMHPQEQIILIKGLRPIKCWKLPYNQISPVSEIIGDNPIEGPKIPPAPIVYLNYPNIKQGE
ncbi:MAG: type IV secretory system conjugative DNA transfer family protein, partial [Pseudomonadota bacterium]